MKVLLIEESETCAECLLGIYNKRWFCLATGKDIDTSKSRYEKPSWCPLSHPLKRVDSDFYIYDRKYLFDNLDREIDLLKGTKAFEEFMKAREEE